MKGRKRCRLNGLFLLLVLPMPVWAELTVIYDSGQTRPIAPYLKSIQQIESRGAKVNASNLIKERGQWGAAQINNLLPIRSPEMIPGTITSSKASRQALNRLTLGNARPFFLVGSDALSQRWLIARRGELLRLGAVGMLIQAETEADVRRISALAQSLSITLGSATDIAKALGVDRYPVLISTNGIEQ
tara:strand:- start:1268 stop:1831 length:564 start_codon:yes stop_codon:yes gene_type:complete